MAQQRRSAGVTLLGPQADGGTQAGQVLAELGVKGPVALVTAGWQEREAEDGELVSALGVPAFNLRLHARAEELFAADPEFAQAYKARQVRLRHLQSFYRVRLEAADDAARAIAVRHVDPELIEEEWGVSIRLFQQIDGDHVARCRETHHGFRLAWKDAPRAALGKHLDEVRGALEGAEALVIAGGHVGSLLNRVRLFSVMKMARHLPIVAWSAGAMILTERVVCFHDYPPYGKDIAQILDVGFGVARGVVVLPDPKRRVRLDDRGGIARFATRMAPAQVMALDVGAALHFPGWSESAFERAEAPGMTGRAWHLKPSGEVDLEWSR